MAITHPKQWNYCINKLGIGQVLDFIGIEYGVLLLTYKEAVHEWDSSNTFQTMGDYE